MHDLIIAGNDVRNNDYLCTKSFCCTWKVRVESDNMHMWTILHALIRNCFYLRVGI